jgi:L-fuculose-phosphate aldolase
VAGLRHRRLRGEIVAGCLALSAQGLNQGTAGNLSARVPGGFLITPSGVAYEALTPARIVLVDDEGGYHGDDLPSSEWRMHRDIYRSRPEAGAVVHSHACHATALACLGRGIPSFHYMVAVAGGPDIRCAPYATFGTQALSDHMLTALEGRKACLLANHGMICFETDLARALWLAGEVETLARQYGTACQLGQPKLLSKAEIGRVLQRFRAYGRPAEALSDDEVALLAPPPRRD